MSKSAGRMIHLIVLVVGLSLASPKTVSAQSTDQITADELVAKHLESIGSKTDRQSIHSRIVAGTSQVVFRTVPTGQAMGRAVLASEGTKHLIGMSFYSPVYPKEGFGFDGKSFIAQFVTPGVRSSLGSFLMLHDLIFKHGLMGGTLSSAWVLQNLHNDKADLSYAGIKKIDNSMLHELKYSPRGGSELQISIYFDVVTFQHLRTEYRRVVPAATGDRTYTNVQERESRYKLIEEFSNFRKEGLLTLPHDYKIGFSADSQSGTFLAEWNLKLTIFTFNEKIDPASFHFEATGPN